MNIHTFFALLILTATLPFTASAQTRSSSTNLYIVAEGGIVTNGATLSEDWASLALTENSGGSFGAAIGYRYISASNFMFGSELSLASSSGSNTVTDCCTVRSYMSNYVSGVYLTAGMAIGETKKALVYGLIGVGGTRGESSLDSIEGTNLDTIDENGEGISFGAAAEFPLTDTISIRAKALYTKYKAGDTAELRIHDTSIMGGIVFNF